MNTTQALILVISAGAVAAMVGFNALLGGWTPARIDDLAEAARRLAVDLTGFEAGEGVVAADHRAAIVLERGGKNRLGLVIARGDGLVTRALGPAELRSAAADARGRVVMRLKDITLPKVIVHIGDEQRARDWAARVAAFAAG